MLSLAVVLSEINTPLVFRDPSIRTLSLGVDSTLFLSYTSFGNDENRGRRASDFFFPPVIRHMSSPVSAPMASSRSMLFSSPLPLSCSACLQAESGTHVTSSLQSTQCGLPKKLQTGHCHRSSCRYLRRKCDSRRNLQLPQLGMLILQSSAMHIQNPSASLSRSG